MNIADENMAWYVVLLFFCLLLSAFFSSSETAFIHLQKLRVKYLVSTGASGAERVARVMEQPNRLLASVLLGNNFVNTAAAALGTLIAVSLVGTERAIVVSTVGITLLLLVFGEITPKTIATRHAERLAFLYVRPMEFLILVFTPVTAVLSWVGSRLSGLTGARSLAWSVVSEEEIRSLVSVGVEEGTVKEEEAEMVHKVFEFGDRQVKEAMIPRPEVACVEKGTSLGDFLDIFAEHPYSRFPVYEDSIDNIVGVLVVKDILVAQSRGACDTSFDVTTLARPAQFVPETKRLGELLTEMQAAPHQMSVVIDEYGGTAGVITMEQMVAEVVGELGDELVKFEKEFELIDEHTYSVDGGMHVDEANEEMGLGLPEGDYETVAGFVLSLLERIPVEGEQIRFGKLKIIVAQMDGVRIKKLVISKG